MKNEFSEELTATLEKLPDKVSLLKNEVFKRIYGQEELINDIMVAILSRGHCLLIGVPGLAKTLIIRTLGEIAELQFNRVQFTPDMMPSDITGSEILEEDHATGHREFKFVKGPVFANLLLADEINRTPPKTQSALLEAMQELHVTVSGKSYKLPRPFFVLATQNPIEQEGTYPLPEAQLDRFMFSLNVEYPDFKQEVKIMQTTTTDELIELDKIITAEELSEFQHAVRYIPIPETVAEFSVRLVRATRIGKKDDLPIINKYLRWGAGPRAYQYLALAGKVHAALDGRYNVAVEDIVKAAYPVLRHRLVLNYRAEADLVTAETIIAEIINTLK